MKPEEKNVRGVFCGVLRFAGFFEDKEYNNKSRTKS